MVVTEFSTDLYLMLLITYHDSREYSFKRLSIDMSYILFLELGSTWIEIVIPMILHILLFKSSSSEIAEKIYTVIMMYDCEWTSCLWFVCMKLNKLTIWTFIMRLAYSATSYSIFYRISCIYSVVLVSHIDITYRSCVSWV